MNQSDNQSMDTANVGVMKKMVVKKPVKKKTFWIFFSDFSHQIFAESIEFYN